MSPQYYDSGEPPQPTQSQEQNYNRYWRLRMDQPGAQVSQRHNDNNQDHGHRGGGAAGRGGRAAPRSNQQ